MLVCVWTVLFSDKNQGQRKEVCVGGGPPKGLSFTSATQLQRNQLSLELGFLSLSFFNHLLYSFPGAAVTHSTVK